MKTLTIYIKDSIFKYHNIYRDYTHICGEDNILRVFKRNTINGEEDEHAIFREWDYYLLEAFPDD